ncbi:hypothetical protein D9757_001445 [Collybiopsis confluens]|uniref:Major facilitator superfamily (MFS) profile domain-containing protein n=1 Tax=Collybiopsis confluens TaxID=2823264 RepID=A0A8H5MFW1_9AGAR|nr:hypothetical protein D9757_001445 [Collybiopsis confluens]
MDNDYFSIDAILAENQKVQCKFKQRIPDMGHLSGGSERDILPQSRHQLPMWLAYIVIYSDWVDFDIPQAFSNKSARGVAAISQSMATRTGLRQKIKSISPIFACGTALFSDGYANGVISDVNLILNRIYDNELTKHKYTNVISSLVFAGTFVGMILFGWLSDKVGRKFGMMTASWIVAFFSLLSAASSGANHSLGGLVAMLSVCRFCLGIGVGAEYPCGSVAASERSEERDIAKMAQHRWVGLATNSTIDFGFVIATFVPLVLFWIFGENHLRAVWRMSLGLGFVPALAVLLWRIGMKEPERYQKDSMKHTKIPYSLVIRRYWKSLAAVSFVWCLYDFIVYPFSIYSGIVIDNITGGSDSLTVILGWNVIINLFYMPGTIGGSFVVDYLGPKWTLITGLVSQAIIGFIMSGLYETLTKHIAAFAVLYGIFLSLGELGPGICTFLLASKSCSTAVRAFPAIIEDFGGSSSPKGNTGPFWVGSALALLSALVTFFFIKPIHADGMAEEDALFREYLEQNGCGTALFSDGYANQVVSAVNLSEYLLQSHWNLILMMLDVVLNRIYDNALTKHKYTNLISSFVFAGTVVGMLLFGWLSDKIGRKFGMMAASWIVIFFSLLCAASSGANHSLGGLVAMLSVCRFCLGIGVGAEYPCGSVAASERSEERDIGKKSQHRWVALATNTMITSGFVMASFVPLVLVWIFGENHLRAVWRMSLGLGAVPALAVLLWRVGMKEPERYQTDSMKYTKIPYSLVIRRYWKSLLANAVVWCLFDFIVYPFNIYSATVINNITGNSDSLTVILGWNVVITLFTMPGTIGGAFILDYLGPKNTLLLGLAAQAVVGFIVSALYKTLTKHIAAFAVLYGVFQSLSALGPGNCTIVLSAKTSATAVRGQYYGVAAAAGKVGAFVGTWVFPVIINDFGGSSTARGNSGQFWVASGIVVVNAIITFFFIQPIHSDGLVEEDALASGQSTLSENNSDGSSSFDSTWRRMDTIPAKWG